MDLKLDGRRALVVGGGGGIGRSVANLLRREGCEVTLVSRSVSVTSRHEISLGEGLIIRDADVTVREDVARLADGLPVMDIVVHAAGFNNSASTSELSLEDWDDQWRLNVLSCLYLFESFLEPMADQGWGRVVVINSSAGRVPSLRNAAYSSTKAAQLSLCKIYATEYARRGVGVNLVCPGPTETEIWTRAGGLASQIASQTGKSRAAVLAERAASMPIGRLCDPVEVAAAVAFLCSPLSNAVIGEAVGVDGGSVPVI